MTTSQKRATTTRDIAAHCGVSIWTVAATLRGDPRVKADTAARVQEAALALGYDPQRTQAARRMLEQRYGTQSRNNVVALLFPPNGYAETDHHFFGDIFRGIISVLVEHGYALLCYEPIMAGTDVKTIPILPGCRRGDVDGLLVFPQPGADSHITQLRSLPGFGERPIISITNSFEGCSVVKMDNGRGAYTAARHLLALGHRHFLQFVFPLRDDPRAESRIEQLANALREDGLDPTTHLHFYTIPLNPTWLAMQTSTATSMNADKMLTTEDREFIDYLQAHPEITAVFALNDNNAINAWYAMQRVGLRVPEDYSLVGFDDTDPLTDAWGNNLLTTIKLPLTQAGTEAGRLMLRQLDAAQPSCETITLPVEFIQRHTTGPAAKHR